MKGKRLSCSRSLSSRKSKYETAQIRICPAHARVCPAFSYQVDELTNLTELKRSFSRTNLGLGVLEGGLEEADHFEDIDAHPISLLSMTQPGLVGKDESTMVAKGDKRPGGHPSKKSTGPLMRSSTTMSRRTVRERHLIHQVLKALR